MNGDSSLWLCAASLLLVPVAIVYMAFARIRAQKAEIETLKRTLDLLQAQFRAEVARLDRVGEAVFRLESGVRPDPANSPAVASVHEAENDPARSARQPLAMPATEALVPAATESSTPAPNEAAAATMIDASLSTTSTPFPDRDVPSPTAPFESSDRAVHPLQDEAPAPVPPSTAASQAVPAAGVPSTAPPTNETAAASLEERIGVTWFTRIGAAALSLGAIYFLKYAVDADWIGPRARVGLGVLAGGVAIVTAERIRTSVSPRFVQVVLGLGLALLYISGYAAYGFYHVLPMPASFTALALVAVLAGALSVRHRAQPVLFVALLGALAVPLLLSTGQDRPVAFFSYLLLVGIGTQLVAYRCRFAFTTWFTMIGAGALACAWYSDVFAEATMPSGAYGSLAARAPALLFVALTSVQWTVLGRMSLRGAWDGVGPRRLVLVGLLFATIGSLGLLFDKPPVLAGALALVALGAGVLLPDEDDVMRLSIPVGLSYFALIAMARSEAPRIGATLGAFGGWYVVAAWVFVRRRTAGTATGLLTSTSAAVRATVAALAGMLLFAALLAPVYACTVVVVLFGFSVAVCVLAARSGNRLFPAVALAMCSTITFSVALAFSDGGHPLAFVVTTAALSVLFLGDATRALLPRRRLESPDQGSYRSPHPERPSIAGETKTAVDDAQWITVLVAVGAPMLWLVAALVSIRESEDRIHAAIALAAAGMAFIAGMVLRLRGASSTPSGRNGVHGLIGFTVAAVAFAAAIGLTGTTVALAWIALATVLVMAGARDGDPVWLRMGGAMFVLALVHVGFREFAIADARRETFVDSLGRSGTLVLPFLRNARAAALVVSALALGISARATSRRDGREWRTATSVATTAAHLALMVLCITEARDALVRLPPGAPTFATDADVQQYLAAFDQLRDGDAGRLAMVTTLVIGSYGALLLLVGFMAPSVLHRWLGLIALAATFAKLAGWDIWMLPKLDRVIVLVCVGALLLGAGYLYARFGRRLLALLREEKPSSRVP